MVEAALRTPTGRDAVPDDARYECILKIASGGMATVYVGRLRGKYGFSRLVAIKRAHSHLLDDEEFRQNLIREARVASRIHHPNVVSVLDVDEPGEELMLVMDYVEGTSLAQFLVSAQKAGKPLSPGVALRIGLDVAAGLHTAHELKDETGAPMRIVHRDVSPQNILIGVDGQSRIADFGIAKWIDSNTSTAAGLKGKFAYMAPEYVAHRELDRRADIFALGTVLWEALVGQRLFRGDGELATIKQVVELTAPPPSSVRKDLPVALDAPILRALAKDPSERYSTCEELAKALTDAARASGLDTGAEAVARTLRELFGPLLDARRTVLRDTLEARSEGTVSRVRSPSASELPTVEFGFRTATVEPSFSSDARTMPRVSPLLSAQREASYGIVDEETLDAPLSQLPASTLVQEEPSPPASSRLVPAEEPLPLTSLGSTVEIATLVPRRANARRLVGTVAAVLIPAFVVTVGFLLLRDRPAHEGLPATESPAAPNPQPSEAPSPEATIAASARAAAPRASASETATSAAAATASADVSAHAPNTKGHSHATPPRSASQPAVEPTATTSAKPLRPGLGY